MKNLSLSLLILCLATASFAQRNKATHTAKPHIHWDPGTGVQVSPMGATANYARMIQSAEGDLFCVYESAGGIQFTKSKDEGRTWQTPVPIVDKRDGINMSVPDIIQLQDASLLVSYNPRPHKINGTWDTTKHFAICTLKSYDGGDTWKDERTLYTASFAFEDGCWEPAQLQLPSGEVQLFFSNEGIYTTSNEQDISMFRSFDGGITWSAKPEIVSFTPHHRDGMPVPLLLHGNKEIVFSIEDNGGGQFKPSIIRNTLAQNWKATVDATDSNRTSALLPPLPDTVYAGAPFIRQLHSGATILSYQSNEHRSHNWEQSAMQVAMGDKEAKHFVTVEEPFHIPFDKNGLWNSLCILKDNTIIAITSTNAFGNKTGIWMIKGRLVRE